MTYYVRRIKIETGREGWVGPIRSERQALREAAAWESETDSTGQRWSADVFRSCPVGLMGWVDPPEEES